MFKPSKFLAVASLGLGVLIGNVGASLAAQTIVGTWRTGASCQINRGAVAIGPMHMVSDEWRCDFHDVNRVGDVVTWKGSCGFPEPFERATVRASLVGRMLHVRINGEDAGHWERCR